MAINNNEHLKSWFNAGAITDKEGHPITLYHGSLNNIEAFSLSASYWGDTVYLTSSAVDASENYGNYDRLKQILGDQLKSIKYDHLGCVYPVYTNIQKPIVIGSKNPTVLKLNDGSFRLFLDAFKLASGHLNSLPHINIPESGIHYMIYDRFPKEINLSHRKGVITAEEIQSLVIGQLGLNEETFGVKGVLEPKYNLLKLTFQLLGYDGVVDYTVNKQFKSTKQAASFIKGVDKDTFHVAVFDPVNIKSSISNHLFYENKTLLPTTENKKSKIKIY